MRGKELAPLASQVSPVVAVAAVGAIVIVAISVATSGIEGRQLSAAASMGARAEQPAESGRSLAASVKPGSLVYIVDSDDQHYHSSGHAEAYTTRRAVPVDTATCRGYEPCPRCCKSTSDKPKAVVNRN